MKKVVILLIVMASLSIASTETVNVAKCWRLQNEKPESLYLPNLPEKICVEKIQYDIQDGKETGHKATVYGDMTLQGVTMDFLFNTLDVRILYGIDSEYEGYYMNLFEAFGESTMFAGLKDVKLRLNLQIFPETYKINSTPVKIRGYALSGWVSTEIRNLHVWSPNYK